MNGIANLDDFVEDVAIGICEGATDCKWDDENEDAREGWRIEARAALSAFQKALDRKLMSVGGETT